MSDFSAVTTAELIECYIETKRFIADKEAELDKELAPAKLDAKELSAALFDRMQAEGLSSQRADGVGIVFTITKQLYKITGREALLNYLMASGKWHAIEIKIDADAFEALKDEGIELPGVTCGETKRLGYRRS
jgi:hypothetical protein